MRKRFSPKERLRIFSLHGGICHLCEGKIQVGDAWDIEHVTPLALGGDNSDDNCQLAHRKCHSQKSREDVGNIARAKRREARHLGIKKSRNPLPGGRSSPWKRTMDGRVIRRDGKDG